MGLLRARESAMQHFRPMLARHDLTEQQWRVLRALSAADHPPTISDIAERTFLLAPSLTRIVGHLESVGLATRATDPHDHRRTLVSLTSRGHDVVARVAPESEAIYNALEHGFGSDRLHRLLDELAALEAVANALEPALLTTTYDLEEPAR